MIQTRLGRTWAALAIYSICLAIVTLTPFDFSGLSKFEFEWRSQGIGTLDVFLNVLGFMPFGVLCYWLLRPIVGDAVRAATLVVAIAVVVTIGLEMAQTLLPTRTASLYDIGANTIGASVGCLIAPYACRSPRMNGRLLACGLVCCVLLLTAVLVWADTAGELNTWDRDFPLLVGNEATLNRPWLGSIFLLALYDRALRYPDIRNQFIDAKPCEEVHHKYDDALMLYTFQEGKGTRIFDQSHTEMPVDLKVMDSKRIEWLSGCGLRLRKSTILRSVVRPENLLSRLLATNSFSIVAWVQPKDMHQTGPARIVSLSSTSKLRNFTLGQEEGELHFRVRNAVNGENGTRWVLKTRNLRWKPELTHIVATYDDGREKLYVNGALVAEAGSNDTLVLIGRLLKLAFPPFWERMVVVGLLLAPGVILWLLFGKVRS